MHEYLCVDGPLSGQGVTWLDAPADGLVLTIAVVDVGQEEAGPDGEPEADYRVESGADGTRPGVLRFVTGRGAWRTAPDDGRRVAG